MGWTDRIRSLTQDAVKHGASALSQSVPASGQVGKLLRKLADEPPQAVRTAIHVYVPRSRDEAPISATGRAGRALPAERERRAPSADDAAGARAAAAAVAASLPAAAVEDPLALAAGAVVGDRYEIRRVLGDGPAYRVYVARHRPWNIDVVLKVWRGETALSVAAPELAAAAQRWTELGVHPHVVYCHYVERIGERPVVVVEHCAGGNLRPWIADGRTANLRIGLNLAIQICHGLERAHGAGLWHGGVRPENLLFTADGLLGIADVGLASAAVPVRSAGDGGPALHGERAAYVAPEQWVDPARIDAHTDIFALGVCLYEMFTGRRPYDLTRGPRREPADPVAPGLPAELAALLRGCVEWEPARRPSTVRAIREAIAAVHATRCRRPSPFAAVAAPNADADGWNNQAVALLLLGDAARADAAWGRALALDPLHVASTYNAGVVRWHDGRIGDTALVDAVARAAGAHPDDCEAAALAAELHCRRGDPEAAVAALAPYDPATLGEAARVLLADARQQCDSAGGAAVAWRGHRGYVTAVAFTAPAHRVLSASDDGTLAVWSRDRLAPLRVLEGHQGAVTALAATDRAAVSGGEDATVRIWDPDSGRCLRQLPVPGRVAALAVDAALTRAVVACMAGDLIGTDAARLLAWDVERDRPLGDLKGHAGAVKSVAVAADGTLAVSGGEDHSIRVWDLARWGGCRRVLNGHEHYVSAVALSADGAVIVSGSWDTTVRVWDARTGRGLRVLRGHDGVVNAVAVSGDGTIAVSAGWDRTVRVWDLTTGCCVRTFAGHDGIVAAVALSSDGAITASGGWDRTVRAWRMPGHSTGPFVPRLSPRRVYAVLPPPQPDAGEWLERGEEALRDDRVADALAAARAARATATGADAHRAAALWEALATRCVRHGVSALRRVSEWTLPHAVSCLAVVGRGRAVLEAAQSGSLQIVGIDGAALRRLPDAHEGRVLALTASADGSLAVSASADTTLRVWELADGRCGHVLTGHFSVVSAIALDAAGRYALSGSYDHTLRRWDLDRGRCERILRGHLRQVSAVALDGARAASGDYGGRVRLWDVERGVCVHELTGHGGPVSALHIDAARGLLVSAGADGTIRFWDLFSGAARGAIDAGAPVLAMDVSADGRWALAVRSDAHACAIDLGAHALAGSYELASDSLTAAAVHLERGRLVCADSSGRVALFAIERDLE
jgi:WD40 repeat protein